MRRGVISTLITALLAGACSSSEDAGGVGGAGGNGASGGGGGGSSGGAGGSGGSANGGKPYYPGSGGTTAGKPLPGAKPECWCRPSAPPGSGPGAVIEHVIETVGGVETMHTKLTINPDFVDNTYGVTAVGWSMTKKGGHTFKDLVGSDNAVLGFHDAAGAPLLEFHVDYITDDTSVPSGYRTLGVSGGEGKMVTGSASDVVKIVTSLDANFNERGYSKYTVDSPKTDAMYTPDPAAPMWDFRVVYEAWVKASIFGGGKGFSYVNFPYMHASPSKTGMNTEPLTPCACPPEWGGGSGGSGGAGGGGGSGGAGGGSGGAGGGGGAPPPPSCPTGTVSCGPGGVEPGSCPMGTVCTGGCCIHWIP